MHVLTSHKLTEGYGLSDPVADRILALSPRPSLCITADQGSADEPRIARLRQAGIETVVTDHHAIPADGIPPSAVATVNPGRADSVFPDTAIAGVGVMWLVMSAVRHELVRRGLIPRSTPLLRHLLDLVAVGTVADAVSLASPANRWFVQQGLPLIAAGKRPCWQVLPEIAECALKGGLTARDIAFGIGPLINAQGRMADAREGILFLISTDPARAAPLAAQLRANNQARRATEQALLAEAMTLAREQVAAGRAGLAIHLANGSPAVHGIVASRLVDRYQRPVICLSPAPAGDGELRGSVRTVPGFDVLAALQAMQKQHPRLLRSFGGHKAAAGLRLAVGQLAGLEQAWHEPCWPRGWPATCRSWSTACSGNRRSGRWCGWSTPWSRSAVVLKARSLKPAPKWWRCRCSSSATSASPCSGPDMTSGCGRCGSAMPTAMPGWPATASMPAAASWRTWRCSWRHRCSVARRAANLRSWKSSP